tara:strand:+ start:1148 stop:1306 length:159 start_codon:yes stop_codon:yes gene_type:complete
MNKIINTIMQLKNNQEFFLVFLALPGSSWLFLALPGSSRLFQALPEFIYKII